MHVKRIFLPVIMSLMIILSSLSAASTTNPTDKTTILTLNRVPTSVYFGDEITVTGRLLEGTTGQGIIGVNVKLIDNEPVDQKVLVSVTTRKYGYFTASWTATTNDPNRYSVVHLIAKFDGSTQYTPAVSKERTIVVRLLPLEIKFYGLKNSYKQDESIEIIFTLTSLRNPVAPGTMRVSFDGKPVSVADYGLGNYLYETSPLSRGQHQFFVGVSKYGYSTVSQIITIHVN